MDKQYDLTSDMKKLFEIKQKQRAEAKEYFQKLIYNPYRPITDGIPIDPAIMRFGSLQNYRFQLYEANPKFYGKVFLYTVPFLAVYLAYNHIKKSTEEHIRSGLVSYEARTSKFIR